MFIENVYYKQNYLYIFIDIFSFYKEKSCYKMALCSSFLSNLFMSDLINLCAAQKQSHCQVIFQSSLGIGFELLGTYNQHLWKL